MSYAQFEQAQRIIAAAETRLDEPVFDDAVTLCWRMPAGQEGALCTALNELTRGGAEVEISKPQYAPVLNCGSLRRPAGHWGRRPLQP